MSNISNYDYWTKALANPAALHNREFAVTTEPECGFFRTYKLLEPVAIWREDGDLQVQCNGVDIHPNDHERVWLACAKNPVSEAWFRQALETGIWPDLDETVAGIGHNRMRADDPESIIADLAKQAESYKEISGDEQAQRALSLRSALLEQHTKVDATREEAKAPFLRSAREVDEIYMPVVKRAKKWADYLRAMVEAYETKKRRLAREAEAARVAKDAQLIADLEAQGQVPATITPQAQIRTGYGRAVSVQERLVVMDIIDRDGLHALVEHLAKTRYTDMHNALMALAQKDVDAGVTVPGVVLEKRAVLR